MRTVDVELGDRSYRVFVGAGLLESWRDLVDFGGSRAALIADRRVLQLHPAVLGSLGPDAVTFEVSEGEKAKNIEEATALLSKMAGASIRRNDFVITLGGGSISDLGAFVASIYMRGIPVVHIPTTLLAQVDAAVGGKTAVNLPEGKNVVGTFHQPAAVVADVDTLRTLPGEEYRSGLAEVIKYALVLDPSLLSLIESDRAAILGRDPEVLEDLVEKCVSLKARLVSADERDTGNRIFLNYGHTLGHALERAKGYRGRHGEAIAVGMAFAAILAREVGLLDEVGESEHFRMLEMFGLPTAADFDEEEVEKGWRLDKKNKGTGRWVLLSAIGRPEVLENLAPDVVHRALAKVRR